ncbi:MAG: hypothetical protein ACFBZ8_05775 [Opitutales bacterium]
MATETAEEFVRKLDAAIDAVPNDVMDGALAYFDWAEEDEEANPRITV